MSKSRHPQRLSSTSAKRSRRTVTPDPIALVPASMLPFKSTWQRLADALPRGAALMVVPEDNTPLRRTMRCVAVHLRQRGHHVATIGTAHLATRQVAPPPLT